jgi:hypothetical protein
MFCPNCGAADQGPNAYCKRCGEWLSDRKSFGVRGAAKPEQRITTMIVFNGLSALLALFSAIALYLTYFHVPEAKWSIYAAGAGCLVITIYQLLSLAFAVEIRLRLKRGQTDVGEPAVAEATENFRALGGGITTPFVDSGSVTESTTEILEPVPRARKPVTHT